VIYWILPLAFIVHDAEEIFTMPGWIAAHRGPLSWWLSRIGLGSFVGDLPATFAQVTAAAALLLLVFVVATAGISARPRSFAWRTLYGGLLGAFGLHGFTHIGQALMFHSYSPGVVTALLVVVPVSLYLGSTLLKRGALDRKPMMIASVVVFALFVPAVFAAMRLSRWLLA
jgi:hypothetical protein